MKLQMLWRVLQVLMVIFVVLVGLQFRATHIAREQANARSDARGYLIQALVHKDERDVSGDIAMMRQVLDHAQLTLRDIDVTEKTISKTLISGYVSMIEQLKGEEKKNPDLMGGSEASTRIKVYTEKILEERKKFPDA